MRISPCRLHAFPTSLYYSAWGIKRWAPLKLNAAPTDDEKKLKFLYKEAKNFKGPEFEDIYIDSLDDPDQGDKLEEEVKSKKEKRGRKKGIPLEESTRLRIKEALKGKNRYERTPIHRSRISKALKKSWLKKKELGIAPKPKTCSVCGKRGHNKQKCPQAGEEVKTKHRKPRSFEHRWKIGVAKRRTNELKRRQRAAVKKEEETTKKYRCGHCKEIGHTRKTCPQLKIEEPPPVPVHLTESRPSIESGIVDFKEIDPAKHPKVSEVDDLKDLYTVPVETKSIWKVALDCSRRAYKNGIGRQRMVITFPILRDGVQVDPMVSPKSDSVKEFRVAALIVEAILKGMKLQSELGGKLNVKILDDEEGTVYWEGEEICAMLFPQPLTLDTMIDRAIMQNEKAPRLQLVVNPQWQPGQVVSDFGFGQLKTLRESYMKTFEDVFYMKQIVVLSDVVIVMRCYPSQWQVHIVEPEGNISLVGSCLQEPNYDEILTMLRKSDTALSKLSWIDRLKTKYVEKRTRLSPFPLTVTKVELEAAFEEVDLAVADRLKVLNRKRKPKKENKNPSEEEKKNEQIDIVTGETARDIKRDPVRQFTTFLGVKE